MPSKTEHFFQTIALLLGTAFTTQLRPDSPLSSPQPPIDLSTGWPKILAQHVGKIVSALDAHPQRRPERHRRRDQGTAESSPARVRSRLPSHLLSLPGFRAMSLATPAADRARTDIIYFIGYSDPSPPAPAPLPTPL